MLKSYKKYISEGRLVVTWATILAFVMRFASCFSSRFPTVKYDGGYLWNPIEPIITSSGLLSFVLSFACAFGISFFLLHINTKHALIRTRTSLPFAFSILLLSSDSAFALFTPQYLAIFFFLLTLDKLLDAYQNPISARHSLYMGFYLALGSLFTPDVLMFLPLFWVGLLLMRSFRFKAILSSLLGIGLVYWIVIFYFVYTNNIDAFYAPFVKWTEIDFSNLISLYGNLFYYMYLGFAIITSTIILAYNYMNNFKDKIRIRACISFFNILLITSGILYLFLPINQVLTKMIFLLSLSMIAAHFFALTQKRWQIYFFYTVVIIFLIFCGFFHFVY
ncbi:hypothetical protein M2132_000079 [Dysgonomonas sp. PH5-45]|uniref:hypothetical protein n=1 Tax=unclassified Dysgonomonas TaxID=2630389 RepID=UPI0024733F37|nr:MULTISPECIES: hypothetical protein [unclassified Dysgonomonas]MDH6353762.1 hypothetical protein [Dysgonomonas sp. PH5-45]MDH6386665.1 hypothetical protein [Dysgonomonas sp. PH5-37]